MVKNLANNTQSLAGKFTSFTLALKNIVANLTPCKVNSLFALSNTILLLPILLNVSKIKVMNVTTIFGNNESGVI